MEKTEKIIERIKKVLELSKNNPSKEEAEAAALKAQKLMAEYHVSLTEIETVDNSDPITMNKVDVGLGNKWKYSLAHIVSRNFRCKHFLSGKDSIVFYGHQVDTEIAGQTFKFLYEIGNKAATNYYNRLRNTAKREGRSFDGSGVKNCFLIGYLEGISESLDKQCTALMIVTPKDVKESFDKMTSVGFTTSHHKALNAASYYGKQSREEGLRAGRNAMGSRKIAAMA